MNYATALKKVFKSVETQTQISCLQNQNKITKSTSTNTSKDSEKQTSNASLPPNNKSRLNRTIKLNFKEKIAHKKQMLKGKSTIKSNEKQSDMSDSSPISSDIGDMDIETGMETPQNLVPKSAKICLKNIPHAS